MRRLLSVLALASPLLAACPRSGSGPGAVDATPPAPADAAVPASTADAAPQPAEVPIPTKPAWTLDRRSYSPPDVPDALSLYGWSTEGAFAFEVGIEGRGTRCAGALRFRVVDARTDRFLGRVDVEHPDRETDDCAASALEGQLAPQRRALLAEHRIDARAFSAPVRPVKKADGVFALALPGGDEARLRFQTRHVVKDIYSEAAEAGAAYRLVLEREGHDPVVIEDGARRRPGVVDYKLEPGFAFFSPDGKSLALFVVRLERAFEGARWSWMANGVTL